MQSLAKTAAENAEDYRLRRQHFIDADSSAVKVGKCESQVPSVADLFAASSFRSKNAFRFAPYVWKLLRAIS